MIRAFDRFGTKRNCAYAHLFLYTDHAGSTNSGYTASGSSRSPRVRTQHQIVAGHLHTNVSHPRRLTRRHGGRLHTTRRRHGRLRLPRRHTPRTRRTTRRPVDPRVPHHRPLGGRHDLFTNLCAQRTVRARQHLRVTTDPEPQRPQRRVSRRRRRLHHQNVGEPRLGRPHHQIHIRQHVRVRDRIARHRRGRQRLRPGQRDRPTPTRQRHHRSVATVGERHISHRHRRPPQPVPTTNQPQIHISPLASTTRTLRNHRRREPQPAIRQRGHLRKLRTRRVHHHRLITRGRHRPRLRLTLSDSHTRHGCHVAHRRNNDNRPDRHNERHHSHQHATTTTAHGTLSANQRHE